MASVTFSIGDSRVRVYTTKVKRPSGLAGVCWVGHDILEINIKVNDETFKQEGAISKKGEKFYVSIASRAGLWPHVNTWNRLEFSEVGAAFEYVVKFVTHHLERNNVTNSNNI